MVRDHANTFYSLELACAGHGAREDQDGHGGTESTERLLNRHGDTEGADKTEKEEEISRMDE
jgi:hypothetical protein